MNTEELSDMLEKNHVRPVNFIYEALNKDGETVQLCIYYHYTDTYNTYYGIYEDDKADIAEVSIRNDSHRIDVVSVDSDKATVSENVIISCVKEMLENRCSMYNIGYRVDTTTTKSQYMYLDLLEECLVLRCVSENKDISKGYQQFINARTWLESGDFFSSPASTIYHNAEYQGLLNHTLEVYNRMIELKNIPTFRDTDIASATLCCLVHDWCKIDTYELYKRNIKDEVLDDWVQEDAYKRVPSKFPFGHGETSMYIADKMFKLKLDEALAIRWHMGKYYVDDSLNDDLEEACNRFPLVNLIQFADRLSIVEY